MARGYGAIPFGIEPSRQNCEGMAAANIEHHRGTVESTPEHLHGKFDIVTIMWTLENCQSCRDMVDVAWRLLKPDGSLLAATGSRILVPFKKPLYNYLSKTPADTHSFRWSANTLRGILAECRFETTFINSFIDSDILLVIGQKTDRKLQWQRDDASAVADFFARWHEDTASIFLHVASGLRLQLWRRNARYSQKDANAATRFVRFFGPAVLRRDAASSSGVSEGRLENQRRYRVGGENC